MTTQTKPDTTETDGIPAFLKAETKRNAPALKSTAATIAAKHNATAPAKPAKQAKAKAEPKAKTAKVAKAKPAHKPADIARTDENPAKSIVPVKFKERYAEHDGSCGDKLAYAIKNAIETRNADGRVVLSMKALADLAKANGIDFARYEHLNNGQKSMNVRNRLRGLLKAGKKVTVGKQTFADAAKALAVQPAA